MPGLPRNHVPLIQENFRGLYSRGVTDSAPEGFFIDCLNNKFNESEVSSRDGSVSVLSQANIIRFYKYKRLGETPRYIILDSGGNLYDSLYPNNAIFSDASFVDFTLVNYNNRAYLSPHNRQRGIPGKGVLVYQGTGPGGCRLAAGTGPTGFTLTAVESASAGNVEAGIHLIAVCYISDTGYCTAPGPAIFAQVTASGGKKITVGNIPIGPSWVSKRIILATKSIPVNLFNGNQLGYKFYFVPLGTINDNTTTSFDISFYDISLVSSADYLLDNLSIIPAFLGLTTYGGRLLGWAANGEEHSLRGSNSLDPETFDSADGILSVDPSEAISGIKNCIEFRKNLVIAKSNRLYGTTDTGDSLSTWSVDKLDMSAGTECQGFAKILDIKGTQNDRLFIADQSGLVEYDGIVKRPELSWNIEGIWKRINKAKFNLVQVVDDPLNRRLLVTIPLDNATAISHILYADYSKAFRIYYGTAVIDETQIKWSIWTFPNPVVSIVGDADATTFASQIEYATSAAIYDIKDGLHDDANTAIDSWFKTNLKSAQQGWINHFGGVKLRVVGSGSLQIQAAGEDGINSTTIPPLTLATAPGYEPDRIFNFINEKMSLRFRVSNFGEYYTINRIDIYGKPLWLRRPS
jgi:hypothetical protein